MGLIEKSIRKRSNQKLAAEVFTQTALSFEQVAAAVREYCDRQNAEVTQLVEASQAKARTRLGKWTASLQDPAKHHYYVKPHPEMRQILIGFGQHPEPILAGRGNTHDGVWAARLSYPAGGNTVGLVLLKWVIGGNDGVLKNRGFYESLLENVHQAISTPAQQTSNGAPAAAGGLVASAGGAPAADSGLVVPAGGAPAADSGLAASAGGAPAAVGGAPPAAPHQAPSETGPARAPAERPPPPTAELIRQERVETGGWAAGLATAFPFLAPKDILGLAGLRALLTVDTGYYSSTSITEGSFTSSQLYGSLRHSLLRGHWIMPSGATFLNCGTPKPDLTFAYDWQLKSLPAEDGGNVIDVPNRTMTNNQIRSAELLVRIREAVKATLATGIHLHLGDGPPVTHDLVMSRPAGGPGYPDDDNSPFAGDYLGGVTDAYRQPLMLPASAANAVLGAMQASFLRWRPGSGEALCVASLAGGRPFDAGSVALWRTGETCPLAIDIPAALPPAERERSYRAALRFLRDIAAQLKEAEPDISAAVGAHLDRIAADNKEAWFTAAGTPVRKRPPGLWLTNWNRSTAASVVPVPAGRWFPVGIRVTTPAEANYVTRAVEAANWATGFKRLQPRLRPDGRPTGRHTVSSRRCCLLRNADGQALPCVRYVCDQDIADQTFTTAVPAQAWFWEVTARGPSELMGHGGGLLLVTGWSHADGVLGYGENLLSTLRAFADVVSATDGQARIQTLYMAT